ncbi:MAG: DUF1467 family protein [Asticcacaulis sp.]
MGPFTLFAIYFIIWWVCFFVALPIGNVSHHEAGIKVTDGGDPGAPVVHNLKKKAIITTIAAAVVFVVVMLIIRYNLIPLPVFPSSAG